MNPFRRGEIVPSVSISEGCKVDVVASGSVLVAYWKRVSICQYFVSVWNPIYHLIMSYNVCVVTIAIQIVVRICWVDWRVILCPVCTYIMMYSSMTYLAEIFTVKDNIVYCWRLQSVIMYVFIKLYFYVIFISVGPRDRQSFRKSNFCNWLS